MMIIYIPDGEVEHVKKKSLDFYQLNLYLIWSKVSLLPRK